MYLLALGLGIGCGFGCGSLSTPFITSYVVGHDLNLKNGFFSMLIFSFGKILSMVVLAVTVSLLTVNFIEPTSTFLNIKLTTYFDFTMVVMGVIIIKRAIKGLRKKIDCNSCSKQSEVTVIDEFKHDQKIEENGVKLKDNLFLFIAGILYGLTPCIPLITILAICSTLSVLNAFALMLFFGIVTCMSPTFINSLIAGILNKNMRRELKASAKYIQIVTGVFSVSFGILPLILA